MSSNEIECAVMFADVADSTRLYETLGDARAEESISQCLAAMSAATNRGGGIVIKTVGDEVMARFDSASAALHAAVEIQQELEHRATFAGERLSAHIGVHYGPAILKEGDLYGDAVNVAARITAIAKAGQILTTEESVASLAPDMAAKTREFDNVAVKGRAKPVTMYDYLWDELTDVTNIVPAVLDSQIAHMVLTLKHRQDEREIPAYVSEFSMGRGENCDLVVTSQQASRLHARIEFRRGKFVLLDESTNGTYVKTQNGAEVYLRREELPLSGTGIISLGEAVAAGDKDLIHYSCV